MGLIVVQCWHASKHPSNMLGLSISSKDQGKTVSNNLGPVKYLLMSEASVLLYWRRSPLWKESVLPTGSRSGLSQNPCYDGQWVAGGGDRVPVGFAELGEVG